MIPGRSAVIREPAPGLGQQAAKFRRPLVSGALAAVAVATTGLLGACSSGQIAQTAGIQPGVTGVNLNAPDGRRVYIRDASVAFHGPTGYTKGSNAPLDLWLFNGTEDPVILTGVNAALAPPQTGASAAPWEPVEVVIASGGNTAAPCSVPASSMPTTSAPSPSPSSAAPSSPAAKSSGKASASASASPSGSASASPSASPSPSVGSSSIKVTVPAGGCVELSSRAAQYLQLAGLPDRLTNTDAVLTMFVFTDRHGTTFTIGSRANPARVPVAVPDSPEPRKS
jgi:hypothetical protein